MISFDSLRHSELVRGERYSELRAVGAEARVATLLIHSFQVTRYEYRPALNL